MWLNVSPLPVGVMKCEWTLTRYRKSVPLRLCIETLRTSRSTTSVNFFRLVWWMLNPFSSPLHSVVEAGW
jgi:hypothetical protein